MLRLWGVFSDAEEGRLIQISEIHLDDEARKVFHAGGQKYTHSYIYEYQSGRDWVRVEFPTLERMADLVKARAQARQQLDAAERRLADLGTPI